MRGSPTRSWGEAFGEISARDRDGALTAEDLEDLAVAAYMVGNDEECGDAWMRAHRDWLRRGEIERAARCAFWQALGLLFRGDQAPALGWVARGRRVLKDAPDCAEQGWLLTLSALPLLFEGKTKSAWDDLTRAGEIAARFGDRDLLALCDIGRGEALVLQGRIAEGIALLDEVMVAVVSDELSPIMIGLAYCNVIAVCHDAYDLRRAREWTDALSRWCESQPDLVPYRGNCLVHRSEIFLLEGAWREALTEARRACELLSGPTAWDTLGSAFYQLGEIQRLRGEWADAEESYRRATAAGREPEPGMSLLRLAQGEIEMAAASIRRALSEWGDVSDRAKILPAFIEIMLEVKEVEGARSAADELSEIAAEVDVPYLHALASHATGAVLLAEGDAQAALADLRKAHGSWSELNASYQAGRARELIGVACFELRDAGTAELEFASAREVYERLEAATDLARVGVRTGPQKAKATGVLSPREVEVLTSMASGNTNRTIAKELFISEKTVARHISNIFRKLEITSRGEAIAYAYRHGFAHS